MKAIIVPLLIAAITITACTKPKDSDAVEIRIKNATNKNFSTASTAGTSFGSVTAGAVTNYKIFDQVIAYPGATCVISPDTIYIGALYCGTPPIPYLQKGKYTLEVFPDTVSFSGYNARFIKD